MGKSGVILNNGNALEPWFWFCSPCCSARDPRRPECENIASKTATIFGFPWWSSERCQTKSHQVTRHNKKLKKKGRPLTETRCS
ncbi:hypothetical protein CapIbe_018132 [Capra ibex]